MLNGDVSGVRVRQQHLPMLWDVVSARQFVPRTDECAELLVAPRSLTAHAQLECSLHLAVPGSLLTD